MGEGLGHLRGISGRGKRIKRKSEETNTRRPSKEPESPPQSELCHGTSTSCTTFLLQRDQQAINRLPKPPPARTHRCCCLLLSTSAATFQPPLLSLPPPEFSLAICEILPSKSTVSFSFPLFKPQFWSSLLKCVCRGIV